MKYLVLCLTLFSLSCKEARITPLEENHHRYTTQYAELRKFIYQVAFETDAFEIVDSAETETGKKIYLTKIDYPNGVANKLKVLIFAQQHGNEQSGKEAALKLISEIGNENLNYIIRNLEVYLIPQVNPNGSDSDLRRNYNEFDLNRDHLLLSQKETNFIHSFFRNQLPEAVLDIHEYYPFTKSWKNFGYIKNFDVQFGSVTNPNISNFIKEISENEFFPFIERYLSERKISHNKYIVGGPPSVRRIRYSTTDINDGRQSTGIYNTFSFILEGRNGKTSNENLKRRTETQYEAIKGWLIFLNDNFRK